MNLTTILLSIVVSASIDSVSLSIGDQTQMHVSVTQDENDIVEFPLYGNELIQGIDILDLGKLDTTRLKDGRINVERQLTLTSFSDSLFYIPPQKFVFGEDTFLTDPLSLNVIQPFVIDTADNSINDIKDIAKAPIWWWGIIRWILLAIGIAALATGIYFLIRYILKKRAEATQEPVNPELLRPAEEVALEKLDKIKAEKIWQRGQLKQYQTELTDVVREYIARRFDVSSAEKTSDETLSEMRPILREKEQNDLYDGLKTMLGLADLVKFAKWNTTPDENERSLTFSYRFVRETTPVKEDENIPQPNEKNDNNQ